MRKLMIVFVCLLLHHNFHHQLRFADGLVFDVATSSLSFMERVFNLKHQNHVCGRIITKRKSFTTSSSTSLYQQPGRVNDDNNNNNNDDESLEDALSDLIRLSSVPKKNNAAKLMPTDYDEVAAFQEDHLGTLDNYGDDSYLNTGESGNNSFDSNELGGVSEDTLRMARKFSLLDEYNSPYISSSSDQNNKNQENDRENIIQNVENYSANQKNKLKESIKKASTQLQLDSSNENSKQADELYQQVFQNESDFLKQKQIKTKDSTSSSTNWKKDNDNDVDQYNIDGEDVTVSQETKMNPTFQKKQEAILSQLQRDIQEFENSLTSNDKQGQEASALSNRMKNDFEASKNQQFCHSCNCLLSQSEINHALKNSSPGKAPKMICHVCNAEKKESKNASPYNVARIGIPESDFQSPWERKQMNYQRNNASSSFNRNANTQGIYGNKQNNYQKKKVLRNDNQKTKSEFDSSSNSFKEREKRLNKDQLRTEQGNSINSTTKKQKDENERQLKRRSLPVVSMQDFQEKGFNLLEERKRRRLQEMKEKEGTNQRLKQGDSKIKGESSVNKSSQEKITPPVAPKKTLNIDERQRYKRHIQQLNDQLQQALQMLRRERKKREILERDLVSLKEIILDLEEALNDKATVELDAHYTPNAEDNEIKGNYDYPPDSDDFSDMVF